jgi:hypothetical protein
VLPDFTGTVGKVEVSLRKPEHIARWIRVVEVLAWLDVRAGSAYFGPASIAVIGWSLQLRNPTRSLDVHNLRPGVGLTTLPTAGQGLSTVTMRLTPRERF